MGTTNSTRMVSAAGVTNSKAVMASGALARRGCCVAMAAALLIGQMMYHVPLLPRYVLRSSPRKRGPRQSEQAALDSRLRGNERESHHADP